MSCYFLSDNFAPFKLLRTLDIRERFTARASPVACPDNLLERVRRK